MLCEPGVRRMLGISLKQCKARRHRHYSLLFNLAAGVVLVSSLGVCLYARYKGRKSRAEERRQSMRNHELVINKLRMYTAARRRKEAGSEITGLPRWDQLAS